MKAKQIIAITARAFAVGGAVADDTSTVEDNFVAAKTLAEVRQARAAGEAFVNDVGLSTTRPQARASALTRAELRNSPRQPVMQYNPAA